MSKEQPTGLQFMQAMLAGRIPMAPIAQTIPMKGVHAEEGSVEFEATADDRHTNPLGGVHGGFAATVMDSVTGCAVHTTLGPGEAYGTIDLNVKMLRPIPKDQPLKAVGRVIHMSRSLGIAEGSLEDAEGRLYAHATATCMIQRQA